MLLKARKHHRMTQHAVALRLNKPQSFVAKYELGQRRLDFVEFMAVAEVLELDVAAFINEYRKAISQ